MAEKDTKPQILSQEAINTLIATDAFKEKAIQSIILTNSLYDNILQLDAKWLVFKYNAHSMDYNFYIAFKLNGNLMESNGKIDVAFINWMRDKYNIWSALKDIMCDSIALAISNELFKTNNDSINIFAKQAMKNIF